MNKDELLAKSFMKVFESISQYQIKKGVDDKGIDGFIAHCATLAAATGAATGFGGFTTMALGLPVDIINNVAQQFRVTLAVIYYKKGVYKVSFTELMAIIGVSLGVEMGATVTKAVMLNIANKILARLSVSAAGKAVPFLGAAVSGSVNYGFIKFIGASVKKIDMSSFTLEVENAAA